MMAKPWNQHRTTITRLYIQDGHKLEDVRNIMKSRYNFDASIRSYRQHFDHWNIGKYNCKKRQRRRQAMARPALLSPPQTPLAEMATPLRFAPHGGMIVGPMRLPSPVSLSARSSISSIHSPEQRPLPDISSVSPQHRLMHVPRFPPYYQGHPSNTASSAAAFEEDMQAALRSPHMTESMLPPMTLDHINIKTEAKYLSRLPYQETTNWNVARSTVTAPYFASGEESNYGLYAATPRAHAEPYQGNSTPRCMDHSTALRSPPPVSKLPEGKECDPADRNKSIHEQQMTNGNQTFQCLVST